MKNHTRVYMECYGYSEGDFIPSELSGNRAVDINHIIPRGMGGSKTKDYCENLMALTREEHQVFENYPDYRDFFIEVHNWFAKHRKPYYLCGDKHDLFTEVIRKVSGADKNRNHG